MQVPAAVLSGNTCEKSVNKTGGKYPEDTGEIFAAAVYAPLRAQQKTAVYEDGGRSAKIWKKRRGGTDPEKGGCQADPGRCAARLSSCLII